MASGRMDVIEFLWTVERPVLQKIDLISIARNGGGFNLLTFLVEKLKIRDEGMGILNFCQNIHNPITEYLLSHNNYAPHVYWLMIYKCIIEDNLYIINLIVNKVDPNGKIAALLLTKAIEKKRSAMIPFFLFRHKFTFNGGVDTMDKTVQGEMNKFLSLIPDATEIIGRMKTPFQYAESIEYKEFSVLLKTYINNTVIKYKSLIMLKMLIQQGFNKDFLFSFCDWSQVPEDFVQVFMGFVFDTLDKINFFFTNSIVMGNHGTIEFFLKNNKILAVDIQKNDDFFLSVFKSQAPGRVQTLKMLIEHCGGIEKLEISPQRLLRFCEENINFETEQLKEYLQGLIKNRYTKKRPISLESDNDEEPKRAESCESGLDILASAATDLIEVKSTEQMRIEKRTKMEEEQKSLEQIKAESEAKIRAKFAEEAEAEKAAKEIPKKKLTEQNQRETDNGKVVCVSYTPTTEITVEKKQAIELKNTIQLLREENNKMKIATGFPIPISEFVAGDTETGKVLSQIPPLPTLSSFFFTSFNIEVEHTCKYCNETFTKIKATHGPISTVCETCNRKRWKRQRRANETE